MASSYFWIKLYQDMLHDPKVGRLSDSAYRRFVELLLLAGDQGSRDGNLPAMVDIAWELRISDQQLQSDWQELERAGLVECKNDTPFIINFAKRQAARTPAQKQKDYRDRKRKLQQDNQSVPLAVTKGNADKDKDKDKDKEGEKNTPAHFDRFNAMLDENPVMNDQERVFVVVALVRDAGKRDNIMDVIAECNRLGVDDQLLNSLFGTGEKSWWYKKSFGKSGGDSPYCKNIINELPAALKWHREGRPMPSENGTTPRINGFNPPLPQDEEVYEVII